MIALDYCQQLLELYILEFCIPDYDYDIDDEPQTPVFDRHACNHVCSAIWKPSSIQQRLLSPYKEIKSHRHLPIFDEYDVKPQKVIIERDKSDDKYRLEALKKKKDRKNAKFPNQDLPYNEFISPARQIQVKILLSKKPLKEYQAYDSDGSIMRKRGQVKQLNPLVSTVKSKLLYKVDKKYTSDIAEETISNQQALFKLKVSTKVKTQYDEPYNFEGFPLKPGVKLVYSQEKKKKEKEDDNINNDDSELSDSDAYQLQKIRKPSATQTQLYQLPKKNHASFKHERSFRILRQFRGAEYF